MHVKYASRHALYPVPNVCNCDAVIDAARAGRDMFVAERETFAFDVRGVMVAARDVVVARAARDVVALRTLVCARDVVVRDVFLLD